MSFADVHKCYRCQKEITKNMVTILFESQEGLSRFEDRLNLCSDCFSAFIDWVKNLESTKLGPVERVARRESSESAKLGPVERVARREDSK